MFLTETNQSVATIVNIKCNRYCILCTSEILPFCQINEKMSIPKGNLNNKPTGALVNIMNHLNNFTDDEKENELNLSNCKYRETNCFKHLAKGFKRKALSFFHTDVCLLTKKFDDFNILLSELNVSFDILAITESTNKKDSSSPVNIQLNNNYSIKHTPTESSADGTLLYISERLYYVLRNDPRLCDPGN